jgi:lipopolysaccharide/colanic/teichoic acid biosynthesis glycosyltransferase
MLLAAARIPSAWLVRHRLAGRLMRRVLVIDREPVASPKGFEVLDAGAIGLIPDINNPIMLHNFSAFVAGADRVVVSCPPEAREHWAIYLKGVGCWGELLVPELHGIAPVQQEPDSPLIGVRVSVGPLDVRNRIIKRTLDLVICVPVIVLLTPVLVIVALAIKLDSPGPILFRQRRMGRGNRLFDVYKFRSMRAEKADPDGARSASRDDDRITRVGRFIRATSLDELPQLFNVLEGDMSLVGPRPHALGSVAGSQLFWQVDQRYWLRHAVKPGITGLAQVRGHRGATDHEDDLINRLRSDLEYLSSWSIYRDVHILVRTLFVVVHKNAY